MSDLLSSSNLILEVLQFLILLTRIISGINFIVFYKVEGLRKIYFLLLFLSNIIGLVTSYTHRNGIWHYNSYDILTLFFEVFFISKAIENLQSGKAPRKRIWIGTALFCLVFFYNYPLFFTYPHPYFGYAKSMATGIFGLYYLYMYIQADSLLNEEQRSADLLFLSPIVLVNLLLPVLFLLVNYTITNNLVIIQRFYQFAVACTFILFHLYYIVLYFKKGKALRRYR